MFFSFSETYNHNLCTYFKSFLSAVSSIFWWRHLCDSWERMAGTKEISVLLILCLMIIIVYSWSDINRDSDGDGLRWELKAVISLLCHSPLSHLEHDF